MKNNKLPSLIPKYMQKFSCVGSECEDTCCSGFLVTIDKKTYKKYNEIRDFELKKQLSEHIVRNKKNTSEHHYAEIKNTNPCPLLNEKKLCSIQLKLGEDYLSQTCSVYPRVANLVDGRIELSAVTSCPEVARIALLNPEKMVFDEIEGTVFPINQIIKSKSENPLHQIFWPLRSFSITILQDRNFSIVERLIILGLFIERIENIIKSGTVDSVEGTIKSFNKLLVEKNTIKKEIDSIAVKTELQMSIIKDLIVEKKTNINSPRFIECINDFVKGLNFDGKGTEEPANLYRSAFKNYYNPFMNKHEYIIENYLVNYIFKNLFPINRDDGVFEDYMLLIAHFSMIKLVLIGMSNYYRGLNEDIVLKCIQSFSKTVEHNNFYLRKILEYLNKYNLNTMAFMSILIKN